MPAEAREHAYDDAALAIGYGQTISQPYVVARIAESLALQGTERVLDVGTGSGYLAAVLAELAAAVVSIERVPALAARARAALDEAGYSSVGVIVGDGSLGVPEQSPFEAIAIAAAAPRVPATLLAQLAPGGRLVMPLGGPGEQRLTLVERDGERFVARGLADVRFVPLRGAEGVG